MTKIRMTLALGVALALTTMTALAHHPFSPEFDWKKPLTIKGTITKVEWVEPHALIYLKAVGNAEEWTVELGSPKVLEKHYGWRNGMLKANDVVTIDGWQARNGRKFVSAMTVSLAGGRDLFAASSLFDEPFHHSNGRAAPCVSDEVCVDED